MWSLAAFQEMSFFLLKTLGLCLGDWKAEHKSNLVSCYLSLKHQFSLQSEHPCCLILCTHFIRSFYIHHPHRRPQSSQSCTPCDSLRICVIKFQKSIVVVLFLYFLLTFLITNRSPSKEGLLQGLCRLVILLSTANTDLPGGSHQQKLKPKSYFLEEKKKASTYSHN